MKTLFITICLIAMLSSVSESQSTSNDTVVCIIDTSKCYVKFYENPCANGDPNCKWQISIRGHYYDNFMPNNKDFACITFEKSNIKSTYRDSKRPNQLIIPKEIIKDRFIVETEEWINKQTDLQTIRNRIGSHPFSKCNFIVFKQDFDNTKADSVVIHRVSIGYSEVLVDSFN